jgi:hypothetical protein
VPLWQRLVFRCGWAPLWQDQPQRKPLPSRDGAMKGMGYVSAGGFPRALHHQVAEPARY